MIIHPSNHLSADPRCPRLYRLLKKKKNASHNAGDEWDNDKTSEDRIDGGPVIPADTSSEAAGASPLSLSGTVNL